MDKWQSNKMIDRTQRTLRAKIDFGCVPCVSLSLTSILIIHLQLKRMENREQMKTADEIVGLVRELVDSAVPGRTKSHMQCRFSNKSALNTTG